jgi:hypothetical protein
MRRDAFGPFATLSDKDLARLLVIVGTGVTLRALRGASATSARKLQNRKHADAITLSLRCIERFSAQVKKRQMIGNADSVNRAAQIIWRQQIEGREASARIAFDLTGANVNPNLQVDVGWLNQFLVANLELDTGTVVLLPSLAASFKWDWPLRTGVIGSNVGPSPLGAHLHYSHFLEPVDLTLQPAACDLILVTGSLTLAVGNALTFALEGSLVVVLGDSASDWYENYALLQVLCTRWRAGAVALCNIPPIEQAIWLNRFIEELTHNRSIDQALQVASQIVNGTVPLLAGDGRFIALSTLAETAKRIGRAMTSAASPVELDASQFSGQFSLPSIRDTRTMQDMGRALVLNADQLLWAQEGGDANALLQLKLTVARAGGETWEPARIKAGDLPPPPKVFRARAFNAAQRRVVAPSDPMTLSLADGPSIDRAIRLSTPRWVQASLFGGKGDRRTERVTPNLTYALEISISPEKKARLVAPDALEESALPASQTGHSLKIAFTPLWRTDGKQVHAAQMQHVHLPAGGDSDVATFYFHTPEDARTVRARIVVLSGNRVLQTLMLAPVGPATKDSVQLNLILESIVSADFGDQSIAPLFDASIIINDNSEGTLGLTVITGEQVEFFEPAEVGEIVKNISMALGTLNTGSASAGGGMRLDDPEMQRLLHNLAINGRSLNSAIAEQGALRSLVNPRKFQFIEAVPKGYFPIELVYEGRTPTFEATLCPHARHALLDQSVHAACEHASSVDFHCPAAFWGFSKCIERHTEAATGQHKFAQPTSKNDALRPFSSVLFGASQSVLSESIDPPGGIRAVVEKHGMAYVRANGWADWRADISTRSPSTLLLLPHSERSTKTFNVPALEISGDLYSIEGMEKDFVIGPLSQRPLVMVLGCSTGLTGVSFVNSISQFRKAGAAVTLGTVALITGRQTTNFVERFLHALRTAADSKLPFDEAFLQVKREMLAEGDPFVLSLVAYGDSGWRLEV